MLPQTSTTQQALVARQRSHGTEAGVVDEESQGGKQVGWSRQCDDSGAGGTGFTQAHQHPSRVVMIDRLVSGRRNTDAYSSAASTATVASIDLGRLMLNTRHEASGSYSRPLPRPAHQTQAI
jgi:hypothetical protein